MNAYKSPDCMAVVVALITRMRQQKAEPLGHLRVKSGAGASDNSEAGEIDMVWYERYRDEHLLHRTVPLWK